MEISTENKMMWLIEEAAAYTQIGTDTLRRCTREYNDFPYVKVGAKVLIIKDKLIDWFSEHRGEML